MQASWGTAFLAIVSAGFVCWALAIAKLASGRSVVPWNARRPVPWALIDLLIFALVFLLASVLAGAALAQFGWSVDKVDAALTLDEQRMNALAIGVVPLIVLLAGMPLVALRCGADASDFGWSLVHISGDVKLGLIGFAMLAPPVFALQAALVQIWPSEHPLMEMFKRTPDTALFGLLILAAVIVAPVFEELMFRVLLQGFLEKAMRFRGGPWELLVGKMTQQQDSKVVDAEVVSQGESPAQRMEERCDAGSMPRTQCSVPSAAPIDGEAPLKGLAAFSPIAISSIVFALLHWQHGPDWIPLTLLAAGMGYVYQRTHRIVPSLMVHMALNGFSMWGLWVQVRGGL